MSLDESFIEIAEIWHEGYNKLVEYVEKNKKHLKIEAGNISTKETSKFPQERINNDPMYKNIRITLDSPAGFNIGEQHQVFLGLARLLTEIAYD